MKATGIRQLAIGAGIALTLAGCEAGSGGKNADADAAAAALVAEDISTQSLDGGPVADPGADPAATAAPGTAAAGTAVPAAAQVADLAADPVSGEIAAAAAPAPKERKGLFGFLKGKPKPATAGAEAATTQTVAAVAPQRSSVRMVDRDVEAPDVFNVTEPGLWDGRPSLGGVWVAYADVRDPERVIIRNADTGAFVIGALFRRERENPGPKLQVSSDAAAALGMLAGSPAKLNVTALRREEVVDPADAEALLGTDSPISAEPLAPADAAKPQTGVAAKPQSGVAAEAIAATAAPNKPAKPAATGASQPASAEGLSPAALQAPAATAKPAAKSTGGKSFLQVGIFSVEGNANNTATSMTTNGLAAQVVKEASQGKTYWRVIVGPAATAGERDAIKAKVKKLGFADAYFVSG